MKRLNDIIASKNEAIMIDDYNQVLSAKALSIYKSMNCIFLMQDETIK